MGTLELVPISDTELGIETALNLHYAQPANACLRCHKSNLCSMRTDLYENACSCRRGVGKYGC